MNAALIESSQAQFKLRYRIVEKKERIVSVDDRGGSKKLCEVFVEWTHADGPIDDKCLLPVTHPPIHPSMPPIEYREFVVGKREVVHDMVTVDADTPDYIIMAQLDHKRTRLAENLGVEP